MTMVFSSIIKAKRRHTFWFAEAHERGAMNNVPGVYWAVRHALCIRHWPLQREEKAESMDLSTGAPDEWSHGRQCCRYFVLLWSIRADCEARTSHWSIHRWRSIEIPVFDHADHCPRGWFVRVEHPWYVSIWALGLVQPVSWRTKQLDHALTSKQILLQWRKNSHMVEVICGDSGMFPIRIEVCQPMETNPFLLVEYFDRRDTDVFHQTKFLRYDRFWEHYRLGNGLEHHQECPVRRELTGSCCNSLGTARMALLSVVRCGTNDVLLWSWVKAAVVASHKNEMSLEESIIIELQDNCRSTRRTVLLHRCMDSVRVENGTFRVVGDNSRHYQADVTNSREESNGSGIDGEKCDRSYW